MDRRERLETRHRGGRRAVAVGNVSLRVDIEDPNIEDAGVHIGDVEGVELPAEIDEAALEAPPEAALEVSPFLNMQPRQLQSSITSIATVETLHSLFDQLSQSLKNQYQQEFYTATTNSDKLSSKLDLKIIQQWAQYMAADLSDIVDINLSNNELCYQLKQLVQARTEINEQLLQTRQLSQSLITETKNTQLKRQHNSLSKRIELNTNLHNLNAMLLDPNAKPLQTKTTISDQSFINHIDPYKGTRAKLNRLSQNINL